MDWTAFEAVLFDLDGVITPTAEVHMRAWDRMFNEFLTSRSSTEPYTDDDYYRYVDGKPRYDGVRSFLTSRSIHLAEGSPDDVPGADTVCGLGNRKNDMFNRVLAAQGITAYPGSVSLMDHLDAAGIAQGVVSSSRNADDVLRQAGIRDYFRVLVDGTVAETGELPGKPAPDTFLRAAELLDAAPAKTAVFEDAISGVTAGRRGGFGLVVGVDRGAGAEALNEAGAHRIVTDLAELL